MSDIRDSLSGDRAPLAVLGLMVAALLGPVLLSGQTFFLRDTTFLFHPWRVFAAESLHRGITPFWNPYAHCGMPFMANWQSAVWYPPNILFYFFPFPTAVIIFYAVHALLAGTFAYLWARSRCSGRWGAALPMVLAALNGYVVVRWEFLGLSAALAWTFALALLTRTPVLFALAATLAVLAGHPVVVMVVLFGSVMLVGTQRVRAGASALIAFLCVLGIAACQWLPLAELVSVSSRAMSGGLERAVAAANAITLADLPRAIAPWAVGSSLPAISGERFPWPTTFHVGVLGCCAVLLGIARSPFRSGALIIAAIAAGVSLALGPAGPVFDVCYRWLPGFSFLRYPSQYLFIPVCACIIASASAFRPGSPRAGIFALLLCGELLFLSWGWQETTARTFFSTSASIVADIRAVDAARAGRYVLSPGTERDRRFRAPDTVAAWQASRAMLYGMTGMPYHLRAAGGTGEPLVPARTAEALDAAYREPAADAAADRYADLGVRVLLVRTGLTGARRYVERSQHLWELEGSSGLWDCGGSVDVLGERPDRIVARVRAPAGSLCRYRETAYPGWQWFIDGIPTPDAGDDPLFRTVLLPPGEHTVVQVYRSRAIGVGIWMTIATLLMVGGIGLIRGRI